MRISFFAFVFSLAICAYSFNNERDNVLVLADSTPNLSKNKPFAIVQLFTSQGCSSCPSADVLLEKIEREYQDSNVYVLSYHVDYWNRLGWKDVFSKKEFSDMQYRYGSKFGGSSVYTPQAIVNGKIHFVGSNEVKMNENISKYLKTTPENIVTLSEIENDGKQITFDYKIDGSLSGKKLKVALVINKKNTNVKRGENSGKMLSSVNIVVEEVAISLINKSGKESILIPDLVDVADSLSFVGYIQNSSFDISGAILEDI
ncbi:DUF1223 domain-containing protein [Aequorivita lipolytica]|nr:DUF1223 domain-containing protein [Aequorivita lipolytica]SRX51364.1 hypothetical protein AEQU2_01847 [Aequorivita lipolytica]